MVTVKEFESPCVHPNGLQWADDELLVMDQKTDDVFVLDTSGDVSRRIPTPTENGSGIALGGGFIWTASNGKTEVRPPRSQRYRPRLGPQAGSRFRGNGGPLSDP